MRLRRTALRAERKEERGKNRHKGARLAPEFSVQELTTDYTDEHR